MYEYKVLERPTASGARWFKRKARTVAALSDAINDQALDRWEFQRTEPGPRNSQLLIFRRVIKPRDASALVFTSKYAKSARATQKIVARRPRHRVRIEDLELLERLRDDQRKIGPTVKRPDPSVPSKGTENGDAASVIRMVPDTSTPSR